MTKVKIVCPLCQGDGNPCGKFRLSVFKEAFKSTNYDKSFCEGAGWIEADLWEGR